MVSIHNTHEFHQYITSLPSNETITIVPNTILSYIQTNYSNIFNEIQNNQPLVFKHLNIPTITYTLFLNTNNFSNLINNLYPGQLMIENDTQMMVVSRGGTVLDVKGNSINGNNITRPNIELGNGIIHIL